MIVDRANGSDADAFAVNVPVHRSDARRWPVGGFQRPATNSCVINLRSYRRQQPPQYFIIADLERSRNFCRPNGPTKIAGFDENYAKRMKVNAGIFVFLFFFTLSGVWLMDGLRQAFGH